MFFKYFRLAQNKKYVTCPPAKKKERYSRNFPKVEWAWMSNKELKKKTEAGLVTKEALKIEDLSKGKKPKI